MMRGAIMHLDVAQLTLYAFWFFFAGLIWYLRQEDRREGYPLESEQDGGVKQKGFLFLPEPKTFVLNNGDVIKAPTYQPDSRPLNAKKFDLWPGAPYEPTGDALRAGVGPGSYAIRPDVTYKTAEGHDLLAPLRVATNFAVAPEDPNPIGYKVIGGDRRVAGVIKDIWVDRSESILRYYEIGLPDGTARLIPVYFTDVNRRARTVTVGALMADQFAAVPVLKNPDTVTLQEEDKVSGFYGGGLIYATASRTESLI